MICDICGFKLVRLNLSAETATEDIMGRLMNDPTKWGGFSYEAGPFLKAFREGHCLLLDEVNLAPSAVFESMEAAIDSKQISIEVLGQSLQVYTMHPKLKLVATQNPNEGRFAMKRERLSIKFLSRFTPIEFSDLTSDELLKIARGQAAFFNYRRDDVVQALIGFHDKWSRSDTARQSNHCFTIRDVAVSIRSIQKLESSRAGTPFDAIMTFYGMRYPKGIRQQIIDILHREFLVLFQTPTPFEIPADFPKCYHNPTLANALKHIFFAFDNQRSVLLVGEEGSGLTQIARWAADYYSQIRDPSHTDSSFCFICTPETTITDWIGRFIPVAKPVAGGDLIVWQHGPITKAVIEGYCGVIDSIDAASAKD
jgi:midasin (ATPase involved in ribosome maturation)